MDHVTRQVFWNVGPVWFFYTLAALAIGAFAVLAYRNVNIWLKGWKDSRVAEYSRSVGHFLADGLLNRKTLRGDFVAGVMHLCIMWGFTILFIGTVLLTIHHDIYPFLFGLTYLVYSFVLDVAGVVMLVGVAFALIWRYILKTRRMPTVLDDGVILGLLFFLGVTGFMIEGFRLHTLKPFLDDWSPVGAAFGSILDGSTGTARLLHSITWWTHAVAALGLIIYVPVSKLFHMFASPTNIFFAEAAPTAVTLEEREKLSGHFDRLQMISFDACMKCNRCENACPSHEAHEPLSPRAYVQNMKAFGRQKYGLKASFDENTRGKVAKLQPMDFIENDAGWWCTTCRACVEECPVLIKPMDIIKETRVQMMADGRKVPPSIRDMLRTMSKHNNPWEAGGSKRFKWRQELGVKDFSAGETADICYWISCIASDDSRNQEVAKAFITALNQAGVDFAHLGKEEACCGEFVKGLGEIGLFEAIVEGNYSVFAEFGISRLVTTSPHCFHTMKNDYPRLRDKLEVENAPRLDATHHTAFIADLIDRGKLKFSKRIEKRVTFHDPCYIGRHNGIYDEPRKVLRAIPGIELVEMPRSRENSFCCGGGGGRMWLESPSDERMSAIRVKEAVSVKADILVTACPFCMSNLFDAANTAGLGETMEVKDIAELVAEAL